MRVLARAKINVFGNANTRLRRGSDEKVNALSACWMTFGLLAQAFAFALPFIFRRNATHDGDAHSHFAPG
ncbi:MAG: hypothetical protein C4321_09170, partial [Chloroflexota bacterium]